MSSLPSDIKASNGVESSRMIPMWGLGKNKVGIEAFQTHNLFKPEARHTSYFYIKLSPSPISKDGASKVRSMPSRLIKEGPNKGWLSPQLGERNISRRQPWGNYSNIDFELQVYWKLIHKIIQHWWNNGTLEIIFLVHSCKYHIKGTYL